MLDSGYVRKPPARPFVKRKPFAKERLHGAWKEWQDAGMGFDIDSFEAADPTRDRTLSGALRKLSRRGYGVADVREGPSGMEAFPWGYGSEGDRSTRIWNIAVVGAPDAPAFEGVLAIRETSLTYRSRDSRDVRETPEMRWYEYLPESAEVAAVLKRHDGY